MSRNFVIVTDSSADLPEEYIKANELEVVNLGYMMNNIVYGGEDGEYMGVKEFYDTLRGGSMPSTFQVSPEIAKKHIQPYLEQGKDVLVVAFSSGLSGTCNSFTVAGRELSETYQDRKIFVVDSLCASLGEGLLVDYAVKKANSGATIEETRDYLEDLKLHIAHIFTVDNLFHLKRGGRVSGATAVVGTLLKIKPVLHVDNDGHLIALSKSIGRKKSIAALVEKMEELQCLEEGDPVFISHGDCIEDVEYLISLIKEKFGEREFFVNYVGSVIGTHSGVGTLALFFRANNRG